MTYTLRKLYGASAGLDRKKVYYPTRRDEEARNPDGSKLRA